MQIQFKSHFCALIGAGFRRAGLQPSRYTFPHSYPLRYLPDYQFCLYAPPNPPPSRLGPDSLVNSFKCFVMALRFGSRLVSCCDTFRKSSSAGRCPNTGGVRFASRAASCCVRGLKLQLNPCEVFCWTGEPFQKQGAFRQSAPLPLAAQQLGQDFIPLAFPSVQSEVKENGQNVQLNMFFTNIQCL
ncbi:hypothetical protein AOLI_G00129560 [Acnodon oligacanthus]